ncbi:hypothetical protein KAR91_71490 [Candidatus Pacearchaeota archaeon]|nr:hypothetical protein [Candidatus Pacearchaeota archaeon]
METPKLKTVVAVPCRKVLCGLLGEKRRKQIESLKAHMLFFGCDISDMTDEEIEEGVIKTAEMFGKAGVTTKEAAEGLRRLSSGLQAAT